MCENRTEMAKKGRFYINSCLISTLVFVLNSPFNSLSGRRGLFCTHTRVWGSEYRQLEWGHCSQGCLRATSCSDRRCAHEHVIHSMCRARQATKDIAWEQGKRAVKG